MRLKPMVSLFYSTLHVEINIYVTTEQKSFKTIIDMCCVNCTETNVML